MRGIHIGQEFGKIDGQPVLKKDTFPTAISFANADVDAFLRKYKVWPKG